MDTCRTRATGIAEREAAGEMVPKQGGGRRGTRGGDKHYDTQDFVKELREQGVTPHVAPNTRPRGYTSRQKKRQRVEEMFGWWQRIGRLRKVRQRGRELVKGMFPYTRAAYHLMRMTKLLGATA